MLTIADHIRQHLSATGKSMRALSLEAGLHEKAVADIVKENSKRPRPAALDRLSDVLGVDLASVPVERQVTAADLRRRLRERPPEDWSASKISGAISAIAFYVRASGSAGHAATVLDRASVRSWLSATTAAAQGLQDSTFTTYASHLKAVLDLTSSMSRSRQIRDVTGPWRALYDLIVETCPCVHEQHVAGPFCAWCDTAGVQVADVAPETFVGFLEHRLACGKLTASEGRHRRNTAEIFRIWNRLADRPDFRAIGVRAVASPFDDGRDKYGMPPDLLAPLLDEFDTRVIPWVTGRTDPHGVSADEILNSLDPVAEPGDPKKEGIKRFLGGKTRGRRKSREDRLMAAGVLLAKTTWADRTCEVARASIASLCKALWAQTGFVIGSIEDLTDPEILEAAATALDEANDEEALGSTYVGSALKKVRKLAEGYAGRGPEALATIRTLIADFEPDFAGIAPRNRLKLQQLTPERIDLFLGMSGGIVAEVNAAVARRRRKSPGGTNPKFRPEEARLLELALAHDIMLVRAPRPGNLLDIDLAEHVRRRADGGVTIDLPAALVKNRVDLTIPLGATQSEFYDAYVERVRPLLIDAGNAGNTRLFPARKSATGHNTNLTRSLVDQVHRRVGIRIHPHLYRHILGWVWLKEDPNALPAVQKLLGHKRLETTMTFYAELDETLALQRWARIVEEKKERRDAETHSKTGRRDRGGRNSGWRDAA